jgi:hypothetical protein
MKRTLSPGALLVDCELPLAGANHLEIEQTVKAVCDEFDRHYPGSRLEKEKAPFVRIIPPGHPVELSPDSAPFTRSVPTLVVAVLVAFKNLSEARKMNSVFRGCFASRGFAMGATPRTTIIRR